MSALAILFQDAARADYQSAIEWYDSQKKGLGEQFNDELLSVLVNITKHPEMYPKVFKDFRQALIKRFPYVVYYRRDLENVIILAIVHASQNPTLWQSRS